MITDSPHEEHGDGHSDLHLSDITFDSDYSNTGSHSTHSDPSPHFTDELALLNKLGPHAYVAFKRHSGESVDQVFQFFGTALPEGVQIDLDMMWGMLERMLFKHYYERQPVEVDGLDGFVKILENAKNVVIVLGAGVSVSAGVPDFRSPKTGLYAMIRERFPELQAPEDIFDMALFREDPRPFYAIARELVGKQLQPSAAHHFIKWLEGKGKVLRIFTQNIDCLESKVGLERVCYCHGSFLTSTCLQCGQKYTIDELLEYLEEQPSSVPTCSCNGVIKPDIIFFGESLPEHFDQCVASDLHKADCFIVMGSSMKVHPVSALPDFMVPSVPQFLINKTPIYDHNYDLQLLGDADHITEIIKTIMAQYSSDIEVYQHIDRWLIFPGAILEEQYSDEEPIDDDPTGAPHILQSADASTQ